MSHLYYGVAYYDEYMPYERLEKDIAIRITSYNVCYTKLLRQQDLFLAR